jgi:hypothetical protein
VARQPHLGQHPQPQDMSGKLAVRKAMKEFPNSLSLFLSLSPSLPRSLPRSLPLSSSQLSLFPCVSLCVCACVRVSECVRLERRNGGAAECGILLARVRANETEQRSIELRRWQEMELAKSGDGGWLEQRICLLFPFGPRHSRPPAPSLSLPSSLHRLIAAYFSSS